MINELKIELENLLTIELPLFKFDRMLSLV